jgi:hypothetical protein
VSVSGHSQGAGHAGFVAKLRSVLRVGMYAGPSDWVDRANQPAQWFGMASATATSAFFGFIHANDGVANYSGSATQVLDVWGSATQFGMTSPVVDVTTVASPFRGSQRLITTHSCVGAGESATDLIRHNCPMFRGQEAVWDVVSFP